jgi:hypothetical protein
MGQTITSVVDMVSYAGDLRRAAKQAPSQDTAEKIQRSASDLEKTALKKIGQAGFGIGRLLDTLV